MTGYEAAMVVLFLIGARILSLPSLAAAIAHTLEIGHEIARKLRDG